MRIISKFQDYYDRAAIYGIDKNIVFHREFGFLGKQNPNYDSAYNKIKQFFKDFAGKEHRFDNVFLKGRIDLDQHYYEETEFFPATFLICGKVYFGVVYSPSRGGKLVEDDMYHVNFPSLPKEFKPFFIHDEESLSKFEQYAHDRNEFLKNGNKFPSNRFSDGEHLLDVAHFIRENALSEIKNLNANADRLDLTECHFDFNSPILMFTFNKFYGSQKNPELRHYGIQSIIDAPSINQEISMYISGVLGNTEKNTIEISDKDKIVGKGFDNKISFRTRK